MCQGLLHYPTECDTKNLMNYSMRSYVDHLKIYNCQSSENT